MRLVTRYMIAGSRSVRSSTVCRAESSTGSGAAVLFSGGLDSAVLLADAPRRDGPARRQPIYVSVGLAWEADERAGIERLLATRPFRGRRPVVSLRFDMRDVYPADALGDPRRAARLRHAGRGRLPRRPQHRAAVEGGGVHGTRRPDAGVHRSARRQPVPGRDAGSSSTRWRRRCRSGSPRRSRSTRRSPRCTRRT